MGQNTAHGPGLKVGIRFKPLKAPCPFLLPLCFLQDVKSENIVVTGAQNVPTRELCPVLEARSRGSASPFLWSHGARHEKFCDPSPFVCFPATRAPQTAESPSYATLVRHRARRDNAFGVSPLLVVTPVRSDRSPCHLLTVSRGFTQRLQALQSTQTSMCRCRELVRPRGRLFLAHTCRSACNLPFTAPAPALRQALFNSWLPK